MTKYTAVDATTYESRRPARTEEEDAEVLCLRDAQFGDDGYDPGIDQVLIKNKMGVEFAWRRDDVANAPAGPGSVQEGGGEGG